MSELSDKIRVMFAQGDDERDKGLTTPDNVVRYNDIVYGQDEKWQVLDVYRPKNAEGQVLPVIVSIHGGGWVYGDKERYQYYCMSLVKYGFAVVNFTYRLAPEFKFPDPIEDANLVFGWICDHAQEYGFDTEHVFAVGDSAGAHQLSLYAAIYTNKEYAKRFSFEIPEKLKLRAVGLNCGAYKIAFTEDGNLDSELMADYLPNKGTEEEVQMVSVINHITKDYLPTFYMTCTGDFLKEQAPILEEKLLENDVPHEFHYWGDSEHELGHVFHLNMKSETAEEFNRIQCEYFKRFL